MTGGIGPRDGTDPGDGRDAETPPGPAAGQVGQVGQDIDAETVLGRELRLAFRGYHMDDVDTLLGLVADAIAERDATIAALTARLSAGATTAPGDDRGSSDIVRADVSTARAASADDVVTPRASAWPQWGGAVAPVSDPVPAAVVDPAGVIATADLTPSPTASPGANASTETRATPDDGGVAAPVAEGAMTVLTASRARRRSLLPSAVLVILATAALVHGTITGMDESLVAAAATSVVALLGVGVALLLTRARTDDEGDDFDWS